MEKGRVYYFDALKILASFFVILIHVTAEAYYNPDINLQWSINYGYNSLSRWAVPIFCMVTGALLLSKEQPIKTVYRRFLHILCLLLFWGMYYHLVPSRNFTLQAVWDGFVLVLSGQTYSHLWYLHMLLGLYILVPFLSVFVQHASRRQFEYILIVLFVFSILVPTLAPLSPVMVNGTKALKMAMSGEYLFYLMAGCYFSKYPWKKVPRLALCIVGILGLVGFAVGYSGIYSWIRGTAMSTPSAVTAIGSLAVFVAFQSLEPFFQRKYVNGAIRLLAPLTLGIYLIHFRPEKILLAAGINSNSIHPIIGAPLLALGIFVITAAIVWVLTKIPFVRRIVK